MVVTVDKLRSRLRHLAHERLSLRQVDLADLLHELDSPTSAVIGIGRDYWLYLLMRISLTTSSIATVLEGPRANDRELLREIDLWANARPALNPLPARHVTSLAGTVAAPVSALAKRAEPVPAGVAEKSQQRGQHAQPGDDEWLELSKVEARKIIKRQADRNLYPSQIDIADEIAGDFRKRQPPILGTNGKPLAGATIKRHALKGISSATKKARATPINRGK